MAEKITRKIAAMALLSGLIYRICFELSYEELTFINVILAPFAGLYTIAYYTIVPFWQSGVDNINSQYRRFIYVMEFLTFVVIVGSLFLFATTSSTHRVGSERKDEEKRKKKPETRRRTLPDSIARSPSTPSRPVVKAVEVVNNSTFPTPTAPVLAELSNGKTSFSTNHTPPHGQRHGVTRGILGPVTDTYSRLLEKIGEGTQSSSREEGVRRRATTGTPPRRSAAFVGEPEGATTCSAGRVNERRRRRRRKSSDAVACDESMWQPDTSRKNCSVCHEKFWTGYFTRLGGSGRHHCRACGRLVCGRCSTNQVRLRDPKTNSARKMRVCNGCFDSYWI